MNGGWGPWKLGKCSSTCGKGKLTRTRKCNNPPPANGGKYCVGKNIDFPPCNEGCCPGTILCVITF